MELAVALGAERLSTDDKKVDIVPLFLAWFEDGAETAANMAPKNTEFARCNGAGIEIFAGGFETGR